MATLCKTISIHELGYTIINYHMRCANDEFVGLLGNKDVPALAKGIHGKICAV